MTLNDIFEQASQIFFKAPNTQADRDLLLFYINMSAQEFWDTQDLPESIRERSFAIGDDKIIAMPNYVGRLRGVRICCDIAPIVSRQSRYQTGSWARQQCNQFTQLGLNCLKVKPNDLSMLTIESLELDTATVEVVISGSTPSSDLVHKTLIFKAGDRIIQTATDFVELHSIRKSAQTNGNIVVRDNDGIEIADIPNNALESKYILIEVGPRYTCTCPGDCNCTNFAAGTAFDLLFKLPFRKLHNDDDVFPIDGYENQFFYKMIEVKKLTSDEDPDVQLETIVSKQQVLSKLVDIDHSMAREIKLDMGRNPFKYIKRRTSQRFYVDEDSPGHTYSH